MKCIKNKKTGNIIRVENQQAENMVGITWEYTSKSEWKLQTRKPKAEKKVEVVEETVSEKQLKRKKKDK